MISASDAIEAVVALLDEGGVLASVDADGFNPSPIGVLVGLPSLASRTLGGAFYEVPIVVVSGDPVNTAEAVNRLYAEADAIAEIVGTDSYSPTTWGGSASKPPLAAIEIPCIVSVERTGG